MLTKVHNTGIMRTYGFIHQAADTYVDQLQSCRPEILYSQLVHDTPKTEILKYILPSSNELTNSSVELFACLQMLGKKYWKSTVDHLRTESRLSYRKFSLRRFACLKGYDLKIVDNGRQSRREINGRPRDKGLAMTVVKCFLMCRPLLVADRA